MTDSKIEVVTLTRGETETTRMYVEGGGHRVYAPWPEAEREVKARVLRSLAARNNPPDGVAFVRAWEPAAVSRNVGPSAQEPTFGITQSGSFGPAAEMAAAARVAQGGPVEPAKRGRRAR